MSEIADLTRRIIEFRDAREWKQFHNPKDVALSLVLEAAEVMEHFQWKSMEDIDRYLEDHRDKVGEELADVLYWVLLLSYDMGIDIREALSKKMNMNEAKYPVEKARGKYTKYTEL